MFGSNNKSSAYNFDTLISAKAEIVGDMHFSGGLHIDGKVFGNIIAEDDSKAVVRISEKGMVIGEISAPHVIVNGHVAGDIHSCEHVELASKATITGNIFYNMIEMVMGAEVSGNLTHRYRGKPENRPAMPKHVTQEKPLLESQSGVSDVAGIALKAIKPAEKSLAGTEQKSSDKADKKPVSG